MFLKSVFPVLESTITFSKSNWLIFDNRIFNSDALLLSAFEKHINVVMEIIKKIFVKDAVVVIQIEFALD